MGLIRHTMNRLRQRAHRVRWRMRYVYLDTPRGAQLRIGAAIVGLMVLVALGGSVMLAWMQPTPAHQQHAVVVAIIALIVAIVAAILAVVLAPKPKEQKPSQNGAPTTEDGQAVRDVLGSVWIDDSFILGWKVMSTTPIKGKSK